MEQKELWQLREFMMTVCRLMTSIPLPVPPYPQEDWPGVNFVEMKEMYDAYNKLPTHLQEVTGDSFYLGVDAMEMQVKTANAAMLACYKLAGDVLQRTGIDVELLMPPSAREWTRARRHRHLHLVRGGDEGHGEDEEGTWTESKRRALNQELEDYLWSRLEGKRLARSRLEGKQQEQEDDSAADAERAPGVAVAVAVGEVGDVGRVEDVVDADGATDARPSRRGRFWRSPRGKLALVVSAALLVGVLMGVVVLSIEERAASRAYRAGQAQARSMQSASAEARNSDFDMVTVDADGAVQAVHMNGLAVVFDPILTGDGEGVIKVAVWNHGEEDRDVFFVANGGSRPVASGKIRIKPGEPFREVVWGAVAVTRNLQGLQNQGLDHEDTPRQTADGFKDSSFE